MTYDVYMKRTTIFLTGDLARVLQETARRVHRPQAESVRDARTQYLGGQTRPWPRSIGCVSWSRDTRISRSDMRTPRLSPVPNAMVAVFSRSISVTSLPWRGTERFGWSGSSGNEVCRYLASAAASACSARSTSFFAP